MKPQVIRGWKFEKYLKLPPLKGGLFPDPKPTNSGVTDLLGFQLPHPFRGGVRWAWHRESAPRRAPGRVLERKDLEGGALVGGEFLQNEPQKPVTNEVK